MRIAEYVNHTALKPRPDTVIETPLDSLGFDSGFMQSINDLLSDLLASYIRKFFLVVVARKAIETANFSAMFSPSSQSNQNSHGILRNLLVDQIRDLSRVHLDCIRACLPMGREDDHRARLHLGRDLTAQFLQFAVCRMVTLIHDVWLVVKVSLISITW